ncbi:MAG: hypothetical protein CMJ67_04475 [Planctomycetaceae bacterium]|nr:hypothetical protein [Planctomycetaceae bacterium]
MAIQTSIKRSYFYWNLVYLVLCAGFGAWGAYDYWVTIPEQYEAVAVYTALTEEQDQLEGRADFYEIQTKLRQGTASEEDKATLDELRAAGGPIPQPLTDADRTRYDEINNILTVDFENTPPQAPASYDGWVNFYVYFIGCGILGAPWFLWKLASRRSLFWRLDDDGSLVTPDGTYTSDQITGIDMSIWMKKSIARVSVEGADEVVLDDYENQDAYKIVGALAHKFHPDEWTEEAKPVKEESDSDDDASEDEQPAEEESNSPDGDAEPEKAG